MPVLLTDAEITGFRHFANLIQLLIRTMIRDSFHTSALIFSGTAESRTRDESTEGITVVIRD